MIINCDDPWLSSDVEFDSMDTSIIPFRCQHSLLDQVWELTAGRHGCNPVAISDCSLIRILKKWLCCIFMEDGVASVATVFWPSLEVKSPR